MKNKILLKAQPGDLEKIKIEFADEAYTLPDELEAKVQEFWKQKLKEYKSKGAEIYDGKVCRLVNADLIDPENIVLRINSCNFRHLIYQRDHKDEFFPTYATRYIATGTFIKTKDGKYIFGVNSGKTAARTKESFIGGMLELPEKDLDTADCLWDNTLKEIKEEINVDSTAIDNHTFLGIVQSSSSGVFPFFNTELNLTAGEVIEKHSEQNDGEMSAIRTVEEDDLEDYLYNIGEFVPLLYKMLTT